MITVKRSLAAVIAVGTLAFAASATNVLGSDGSAPEQPPSDPFGEVTTPTGPELPLERVAAIAEAEAAQTGEPNPSLAIGTGTLRQAMGTFDASFSLPEPVTDPGYQRLLDTPVDLVVMKGQSFTLTNTPVRPDGAVPSGGVLFLVIDSHRGAVMGRGLPTPEELEHAEASSPALAASAHTISFHAVKGTIAGLLLVSGGPARKHKSERQPTHAVIVKKGTRTVAVAHTNGKGAFSIRLRRGTYTLKGTVGSDCQPRTVVVKPAMTVHVKLLCSIL